MNPEAGAQFGDHGLQAAPVTTRATLAGVRRHPRLRMRPSIKEEQNIATKIILKPGATAS